MEVQISRWEGVIFGERGANCKVYGHSAVACTKTAEPIVMPFGLWAGTGPRNHKLDGVQIPHEKGFLGSLGLPESSTQTASRLVQPFLQGSQCNRPTARPTDHGHATRSLTIDHIYVRSTAMRCNNTQDSTKNKPNEFLQS